MFVTSKKHNVDLARARQEISELRLILRAALGEKAYGKALKQVDKTLDGNGLADYELQFEEISNPLLDENKLPPRSEYNERLEQAIAMFQDNHPVSAVAVKLAVAKKTARRYLKIALTKRKIKKADFEALNQ